MMGLKFRRGNRINRFFACSTALNSLKKIIREPKLKLYFRAKIPIYYETR